MSSDELELLPATSLTGSHSRRSNRKTESQRHQGDFLDDEHQPLTESSIHDSFQRYEAERHPEIIEADHVREARYSKRSHTRIFRSLPNFRDLGGQRAQDGRVVRSGLVFRAASVNKINPNEVSLFVNELGIRTLIDLRHKPFSGQLGPLEPYYRLIAKPNDPAASAMLRSRSAPSVFRPEEVARDPYLALSRRYPQPPAIHASPVTPLISSHSLGGVVHPSTSASRSYSTPLDDPGVVAGNCYPIQLTGLSFYLRFISHVPVRTWCQVLSDVFCCRTRLTKARISGAVLSPLGLEGLYRLFLDSSTKEILSVLRLYANPDNYPVVVYCNHGKDRTGIIIALVLSICNVDLDSIILNYSESHHHLTEWHDEIREDFRETGVDPDVFAHTPQEVMRETVHYITTVYGSVQAYLKLIGLTEEEQARIRSIILCRTEDDGAVDFPPSSVTIPQHDEDS